MKQYNLVNMWKLYNWSIDLFWVVFIV